MLLSSRKYRNKIVSKEISSFAKYFDALVYVNQPKLEEKHLHLFNFIENPQKNIIEDLDGLKDLDIDSQSKKVYVLNGTFNHHYDIQGLLIKLKKHCNRSDRVVTILYNPYFRWLYKLLNIFGFRKAEVPKTFITYTDLRNIAKISDYEIVKARPSVFFPFQLFGLGTLVNKILPCFWIFNCFAYNMIVTLRPVIKDDSFPSLSILIPARNEKGNIENALKRLPDLGCQIEVIFVEGHSQDETWEEIQRVIPLYKDKYKIKAYQQSGKGKNDAVRLGFSHAQADLLTILDADLTMPPELLGRFYEAYRRGYGDFINGNRLTYPMEGEAMRFLNHLGNIFFAKALSFVLDSPLGDTLCGTKLISNADYKRVLKWRDDFGDFDPFGDFELLFPASVLNLGIADVPIRYRDRTYGSTQISRFRHGAMLLKMTLIGLCKLKMGR